MGEWSHDVKKPSGLCKAMLTHRDNVEKKLSQKKKKKTPSGTEILCTLQRGALP